MYPYRKVLPTIVSWLQMQLGIWLRSIEVIEGGTLTNTKYCKSLL